MKAHKPEMIAAWAKQYGISGYEMWDPKFREENRVRNTRKNFKRKEKGS